MGQEHNGKVVACSHTPFILHGLLPGCWFILAPTSDGHGLPFYSLEWVKPMPDMLGEMMLSELGDTLNIMRKGETIPSQH
jgi:hypothetical protein